MEEAAENQPERKEVPSAQPQGAPIRYDYPTQRRGGGRKLLFLLIVAVLIAAFIGGFALFGGRQRQEEVAPTPTPTAEPSPTPPPAGGPEATPTPTKKPTPTKTPTPSPTKKPTKGLSVLVLNGSGVAGAAREAADYLAGLGYAIQSVGNAETQNLENTTIQIKKEKETLLSQLRIDLDTKYTIGTVSAALSATASADAVVTIGKK